MACLANVSGLHDTALLENSTFFGESCNGVRHCNVKNGRKVSKVQGQVIVAMFVVVVLMTVLNIIVGLIGMLRKYISSNGREAVASAKIGSGQSSPGAATSGKAPCNIRSDKIPTRSLGQGTFPGLRVCEPSKASLPGGE